MERLFVCSQDTISVFNAKDYSLVETIKFEQKEIKKIVDHKNYIYCLCALSSRVLRIDKSDFKKQKSLPTGAFPVDACVSFEKPESLFVCCEESQSVWKICIDEQEFSQTMCTKNFGFPNKIFIQNNKVVVLSDKITKFDLELNKISEITLEGRPVCGAAREKDCVVCCENGKNKSKILLVFENGETNEVLKIRGNISCVKKLDENRIIIGYSSPTNDQVSIVDVEKRRTVASAKTSTAPKDIFVSKNTINVCCCGEKCCGCVDVFDFSLKQNCGIKTQKGPLSILTI